MLQVPTNDETWFRPDHRDGALRTIFDRVAHGLPNIFNEYCCTAELNEWYGEG